LLAKVCQDLAKISRARQYMRPSPLTPPCGMRASKPPCDTTSAATRTPRPTPCGKHTKEANKVLFGVLLPEKQKRRPMRPASQREIKKEAPVGVGPTMADLQSSLYRRTLSTQYRNLRFPRENAMRHLAESLTKPYRHPRLGNSGGNTRHIERSL